MTPRRGLCSAPSFSKALFMLQTTVHFLVVWRRDKWPPPIEWTDCAFGKSATWKKKNLKSCPYHRSKPWHLILVGGMFLIAVILLFWLRPEGHCAQAQGEAYANGKQCEQGE
jgi:hypothetical protein